MRLALFTAVYPAAMPYFGPFVASVARQEDRRFDLWIAVDGVAERAIEAALGDDLTATLVHAPEGATPVEVRTSTLTALLDAGYDGVILVDSDDLLATTRVAAARDALVDCDLVGCSLDLVDAWGDPLGVRFGCSPDTDLADILVDSNVFGFSNSAYRAGALEPSLGAPSDLVALDWYCATLALGHGALARFDPVPRMAYRQHGANSARVLPPFSAEDLERGVVIVSRHSGSVAAHDHLNPLSDGLSGQRAAALERLEAFERTVLGSPEATVRYLALLATPEHPYRWWEWVASRRLEKRWRP